ncbi:MAG: hypothetical protein NZ108_10685, partial [Bacteroidia bacterium]|nr:hypothetical protein [Bacteroidia bacterium]
STAGQTIIWNGTRWDYGFTSQPGTWLRNGTGGNRKLYTNYFSDSIGIGTATPNAKVYVKGIVNTDSAFFINGIHGISFRRGNRNLAIGNNSGRSLNTSSADNILIGESVGANITGSNNIGFSAQGSLNSTSATIHNNIVVGFFAGSKVVSNNNILIGYYAGFNFNNSIGRNIILSNNSLNFNGNNTVGIGYGNLITSNQSVLLLTDMTHSHHNSVIINTGFLDANANQTDNVLLGLYNLGHGSYNVVAGLYCGPNKLGTSKNHNVLLGHYAGGYTRSLNQGICIGTNAGSTDTLGTRNNFIGSGSGKSIPFFNLSDCSAIGYNAIVNQTKSMVLGGTGADAVNVGIDITAPSDRLHLTGNLLINGALMPDGNPGSLGQMLMSQGSSLPPTWV